MVRCINLSSRLFLWFIYVQDGSYFLHGVDKSRLVRLCNENKWKTEYKPDIKTWKMRKAVDRRYDGPRHMRTRDYDSWLWN